MGASTSLFATMPKGAPSIPDLPFDLNLQHFPQVATEHLDGNEGGAGPAARPAWGLCSGCSGVTQGYQARRRPEIR